MPPTDCRWTNSFEDFSKPTVAKAPLWQTAFVNGTFGVYFSLPPSHLFPFLSLFFFRLCSPFLFLLAQFFGKKFKTHQSQKRTKILEQNASCHGRSFSVPGWIPNCVDSCLRLEFKNVAIGDQERFKVDFALWCVLLLRIQFCSDTTSVCKPLTLEPWLWGVSTRTDVLSPQPRSDNLEVESQLLVLEKRFGFALKLHRDLQRVIPRDSRWRKAKVTLQTSARKLVSVTETMHLAFAGKIWEKSTFLSSCADKSNGKIRMSIKLLLLLSSCSVRSGCVGQNICSTEKLSRTLDKCTDKRVHSSHAITIRGTSSGEPSPEWSPQECQCCMPWSGQHAP